MKMSDVFASTIRILKRYSKEHPEYTFELEGKEVKIKDLISALTKLLGWLYKDLSTDNIERIIRCYDCRHYKKYRKKGAMKAVSFYACSIDRKKRRPDFFCKDGEPR